MLRRGVEIEDEKEIKSIYWDAEVNSNATARFYRVDVKTKTTRKIRAVAGQIYLAEKFIEIL